VRVEPQQKQQPLKSRPPRLRSSSKATLLNKPQQEREQITAEHDLFETGPSVTWRAMTFELSPSLMFCPDTSPDREDNDASLPLVAASTQCVRAAD
jgi:hypothetical protein